MRIKSYKYLIAIIVFHLFGRLVAQNFPVQSNLILNPPYTLSLPQYSAEPQRIQLTLLNKDFATPLVEVYLQLVIEGPGITLTTKNTYRPVQPLTLNAGVPLLLNGSDLSDLFNPMNLNFEGLNQTQFIAGGSYLPEGMYRFSIYAKTYHQQVQVSNFGVSNISIFRHLPPIINLPLDKSFVTTQNLQYIAIQFTPRHTISAELITKVRYKIRMVEILTAGRNPNEAMQSNALSFFETITDQTNFIYGAGEPTLIEGRTYAIQVQAIDVDGKDLFDNHGYSQVVSFVYGSACPVPQNVKAVAEENGLQLLWDEHVRYRSYVVNYRVKGDKYFKTELAFRNAFMLPSLQAGSSYELKVSGVCAEGESQASNLVEFKAEKQEGAFQQVAKNCGKDLPSVDLSNKNPLLLLQNGDIIKAADFEVRVTASKGGNGYFSGAGFVKLPFTGKVPLPCTFENIFLNTDKRLINGQLSLLQSPLELSNRTVQNISKSWRNLFGSHWNLFSEINYKGSITKIREADDGAIYLEGSNGTQKILKGSNIKITDQSGKIYFISAGGKVSEAEGPIGEPIVKNIKSGEDAPSQLPPGMAKLFFYSEQNEAYDAMSIAQLTAGKTYDRMECSDTAYFPAWKLLKAAEKIQLKAFFVRGKQVNCPLDSIRFVRSDGTLLPHTRNGNEFSISATGRMNLYADAIWAVANYRIDAKAKVERWILGKINLINVDIKKQTIVLVPVNEIGINSNASQLQKDLNQMIGSAGVQTDITMDHNLLVKDYDTQKEILEVSKTTINLGYSEKLNRFISAYQTKNKFRKKNCATDTVFLFLLNQSADAVKGFMGLGEQYGFLFLNNAVSPQVHTLAHEIGHGCFALEHVFLDELSNAGHSQNIMDYAAPYALFNYDQWVQIHDPSVQLHYFEDQQKSRMLCIDNISVFKDLKNEDGTYTFISHTGEYITLPATAKNLRFSTQDRGFFVGNNGLANQRLPSDKLFPLGCLMAFEMNQIEFSAKINNGYTNANKELFEGEKKSKDMVDGIMVYLLFENNKAIAKAAKFKSSLKVKTDVKGGEGATLKSFAVVQFETDQLQNDFASVIANLKSGPKTIENTGAYFTVFGNDSLWFRHRDSFYNASLFLTKILSNERSLADYVYYFNLVNLKPNDYYSFVNCLNDKITRRAIVINEQLLIERQKQRGEMQSLIQHINSSSEQMFAGVYQQQLKDLANGVSSGTNMANQMKKARLEKWLPENIYKDFKTKQYLKCHYYALEVQDRIAAINALIEDPDHWVCDGTPILKQLFECTPSSDELVLLKDGVMGNKFRWLYQLWYNRDEEDIGPVFDIINSWVYEYYDKLKITPSTNEVIAIDLFDSPLKYEQHYNEFYIGIKKNTSDLTIIPQQFTLTCQLSIWCGGKAHYAQPSDIIFLENGLVSFNQTYWVNDIRPQVYREFNKPNLTTVIEYSEDFNPFEIMTVTMGSNYFELGLVAGQTMQMPAFMAMQMQYRLEEQVASERTRNLVNKAMIGITAISAVYTGGSSLNLTAALMVATSTADLAISDYKSKLKTQAEWDANKEFFHEWEAFHTAAEYAMAAEGAYALGKSLPKYGTRINLIKSWNGFKKFCKNNLVSKTVADILTRLKKGSSGTHLKVGDEFLKYKIDQIKYGNNGKIAIIARAMGNEKVKGVKDIYKEMLAQGYTNVEIFDIISFEGEWAIKFKEALKEMTQLTNDWKIYLDDETIKTTLMYKLDQEWIEYLLKENYTIIDFGDLYLKSGITMLRSPFYDMELRKVF